jgi:aspartate/methionine/tyrosine aminotransferase
MRAFASGYLQWAKTRKPVRFNLASSAVLPCEPGDLGIQLEDIEINGPGSYGFQPLQQAIAAHCSVSPDCVVAASGASMANFIAMGALIQPGDEVLIEHPVYEPLLAVARFFGADTRRFPRDSRIRDHVSSRTRLIVTTNLHNPTCEQYSPEELSDVVGTARDVGAMVLVDEVYLECMYARRSSAIHAGNHVICTSSLTKAYGLSGLRCGWILAQPDLARRMWQFKDLIDSGAPHPSEKLSVLAFQRLDVLAGRAKTLIGRNRELLVDFLGCNPQLELAVPEYGTCVFPRIKSAVSEDWFELLHDRYETDVVPGRFFEKPDHFRLGLGGDSSTLAEGLRRLRDALESMR